MDHQGRVTPYAGLEGLFRTSGAAFYSDIAWSRFECPFSNIHLDAKAIGARRIVPRSVETGLRMSYQLPAMVD